MPAPRNVVHCIYWEQWNGGMAASEWIEVIQEDRKRLSEPCLHADFCKIGNADKAADHKSRRMRQFAGRSDALRHSDLARPPAHQQINE